MKGTLFYTLLLCCFLTYGQKTAYEFIGTLQTHNHTIVSVKLKFDVDSSGRLIGTSIMDYYGENHTVSSIQGTWNKESGLLSFKELENIETKANVADSSFCYIEVTDLAVEEKYQKSVISGPFKGYYSDGEICANGTLFLFGAEELEQQTLTTDEPASKVENRDEESTKTVADNLQAQQVKETLNPGETLLHEQVVKVVWQSGQVKLKFWDSYKEDNDKINVYFNDSLVHKALVVKAAKQTLFFDLTEPISTIRIEAENEGTSPPNTVNVHLIDGGTVKPLITKLRKKQFVEVEIIKSAK